MTLRDYINAMPKVELHVHLEGSVEPETLLELARKNGAELPASTVDELRQWYAFRDFTHFIAIYRTICDCLQSPDDFARISYEYGRSMAQQNIRYAEVTWTPYAHLANGQFTWSELLAGVNAGRARARKEWGVEMRWITDISRGDVESAMPLVRLVTTPDAQAGGVIALGLGGQEIGYPPEWFAEAFSVAREHGLHSIPHAGEAVGPQSVWGAIRALKAERIGHGVRSVEDPQLIAYLVRHQIPLEVNPTSNLRLGIYASYHDHPLRQLVEAGVSVTLNSDDPPLFNTTLNDEYFFAVTACGLSVDQLEDAALNAVQASYLPPAQKSALLAEFRAEYDRLRAQFGLEHRS